MIDFFMLIGIQYFTRRKKYKQLKRLRRWRDSLLVYELEYLSEATRLTLVISLLKIHPNISDVECTRISKSSFVFIIQTKSFKGIVLHDTGVSAITAAFKTLNKFYLYEAKRILDK